MTYAQLTQDHFNQLRSRMNSLMAKLRPIAVSIVDAFDINDQSLLSTLGNQITFLSKFFFLAKFKIEFPARLV